MWGEIALGTRSAAVGTQGNEQKKGISLQQRRGFPRLRMLLTPHVWITALRSVSGPLRGGFGSGARGQVRPQRAQVSLPSVPAPFYITQPHSLAAGLGLVQFTHPQTRTPQISSLHLEPHGKCSVSNKRQLRGFCAPIYANGVINSSRIHTFWGLFWKFSIPLRKSYQYWIMTPLSL